MPNLINTDSAGNVFYNYVTPVTQGATATYSNTILNTFFETKLGSAGGNWNNYNSGGGYYLRYPAPGLEMKTGAVSAFLDGDTRMIVEVGRNNIKINTNNTNTSTYNQIPNDSGVGNLSFPNLMKMFAVQNDYAVAVTVFDTSLTTCHRFIYAGWLRENVYTTTVGCVLVQYSSRGLQALRPLVENSTTPINLSSAADSITSPPIVCTPGTDPGDGSETFTDVVIRDAAAPNNPVGKLWNCIDMPATCNVGELWRNTGAYDGDASASEQDIYLCVMPWGTRKLGMRVWTENVT